MNLNPTLVFHVAVAVAALSLLIAILYFLAHWLVLSRPEKDAADSPLFRRGQRVPEWDEYQHQLQWETQMRLERAARRRARLSPSAQALVTLRVVQAIGAAARRLAEDPLTSRTWYVDPAEIIPGFYDKHYYTPWAYQ